MKATEGDNKKNKGEGGHGSGGGGRGRDNGSGGETAFCSLSPTPSLPSYVVDVGLWTAIYSPSIKPKKILSSSNDASNWNALAGGYYSPSVPIDRGRRGSSREKESVSNQLVVTSGRSSTRKRQDSSHQTTRVTKKKVKKSKRDKKDQTNVKNMVSPFFSLTKSLQLQILEYCTVPMLGTLVPVCKEFNRMVKCNHTLWEPFLRQLLRTLYDDAIMERRNPNPKLIERTDWRQSTSMVRWIDSIIGHRTMKKETINWHVFDNLDEYLDEDEDEEIVRHHRWLVQDVSLRDYYHEAGRMAYLNIKIDYDNWEESCKKMRRCVVCFKPKISKIWNGCSCDGVRGDVDYSAFANLPKIQWWE